MITEAGTVALGFDYPSPDSVHTLRVRVDGLPVGAVRDAMTRFVRAVSVLDLGVWEELHTRTLDLSPLFVPYVGHVIWGESYRRGAFMADMNGHLREQRVDTRGELPDHLAPVLRLLDTGDRGPEDLAGVLPTAVSEMRRQLKKAEPDNPYFHLLDAAAAAVEACLREGASA